MGTESQVRGQDLITDFCEAYVSQHRENWPTDEWELARAFVKFFEAPLLADMTSLQGFFTQTNIELRKCNLPAGLLGVNMSFEGKRRIDLSQRREQVYFRLHTVLHEIREIIENDFLRLGFSTTNSRNIEDSADEFVFCAVLCSTKDPLENWVKTASEIESKWRRWTILGLICAGAMFFCFWSFIGAFFPHVKVTRSGVRFER